MTNKHTKKALLSSALALILCFSMLVGTTFAWFTDSASSASNVIKSGNLDIDVQYTLDGKNWASLDGAKNLFQKGLWEPGHTEVVALKIENKGSLALKYNANMNVVNENQGTNKAGEKFALSEVLNVSTLVQQANDEMGVGDITLMLAFMGENSVKYENTASFAMSEILRADQELHPGVSHYMFVKVDMPETVGNEANHNGEDLPFIDFGINVLATQYTYEEDSFGNQYDANAWAEITQNSLTPENYATTTLESNTNYTLVGDFAGKNVSLVMAKGVENVVFDGSQATNINELIVTQNGQLIDNATAVVGARSGKVTIKNFNVLSQINVFACKTEVEVAHNTAEALMVYAGNCDVKVHNNNIDANFESHRTYRDENNTWNTNNYGIALNIFDYNLWLDNNTVTNAVGHAIGINGWEGTIDNGEANVIESFKNNNITVNSTQNKRAAFKVWDDETYASNDDDTNVVNPTTQAFIDAVLEDGSNTFNITPGYEHTIFSIYNVNTNQ